MNHFNLSLVSPHEKVVGDEFDIRSCLLLIQILLMVSFRSDALSPFRSNLDPNSVSVIIDFNIKPPCLPLVAIEELIGQQLSPY